MSRVWRDRLPAALAVALAYYAGAHIGALLKIPPSTPSAIWPPNAILLAALLMHSPRDWWWLLLAALPSHLAVELRFGWPTSLVLALFITNCSEALLGAVAVRALSDAPDRFDSLPRMSAFIAGGAMLAPILSSFADAGVVALLRGDAFWAVWRARTFSNILADLILVPAVVALVRDVPRWMATARPRVQIEAALLAIFTIAIAVGVFEAPIGNSLIPGSPRTPVAFLLPCLLWAAVRFGPNGVSLALVSTALVASWAGTHGRGPFYGLPAGDAVLALQLFLSVMAVPLLCLGALIQERWRTEAELADRLAFEQLLSRMSGAFVLAPGRGVDDTAAIWLGKLAVYLQVDCAWLLVRSTDAPSMSMASSWVAPRVPVVSSVDPMRDLGWLVARTLDAAPVAVENVDALASDERASMRRLSVRAVLAMPIGAGGRVLGALVLASTDGPRPWPELLRARLRLVSEVFAGALARQAADEALRAGEAMKSAILASLSTGVAVLDRTGRIIAVNERWTALAHDQHEIVTGDVSVGANYLELCLMASMQGAPHAGAARAGIEAVLGRSRSTFTLEYETDGPAGERWAVLSAVPLSGADGGAVVTHTDITERRRAELEAQRSRQELAHFSRVSTMGELTASLAHQLNQPLAGILSNAQAARRLLDGSQPDVEEIRSILDDIVEDDRRAADVIQQLRELMRKGRTDQVLLDLNTVLQSVVRLVSSDAIIRGVSVEVDLTPEMAIVRGNRVELQQVILNLLLNALEAVGTGSDDRRVLLCTQLTPTSVEVLVEDTGVGIVNGADHRIFEPFFSTKPGGMGMGLSIARSIVEAHDGRIAAKRRTPRGTIMTFVLPLVGGRAV